MVDDEDYEFLSKWLWRLDRKGYAMMSFKIGGKTYCEAMHRLIMRYPKELVDHMNRNKLDNRKSNLRLCNNSQSSSNRKMRRDNGVGYKGVGITRNGKYDAHVNGKYLGVFSCALEAAMAYDREARKVHGEFSSLNFPDGGRIVFELSP